MLHHLPLRFPYEIRFTTPHDSNCQSFSASGNDKQICRQTLGSLTIQLVSRNLPGNCTQPSSKSPLPARHVLGQTFFADLWAALETASLAASGDRLKSPMARCPGE